MVLELVKSMEGEVESIANSNWPFGEVSSLRTPTWRYGTSLGSNGTSRGEVVTSVGKFGTSPVRMYGSWKFGTSPRVRNFPREVPGRRGS